MRLSIFHMKLIHTLVFAVLSACVVYTLYSGIFNHVTHWTWLAVVIVLGEDIILKANDWRCPLTTVAEKSSAASGSVTDIFLPSGSRTVCSRFVGSRSLSPAYSLWLAGWRGDSALPRSTVCEIGPTSWRSVLVQSRTIIGNSILEG